MNQKKSVVAASVLAVSLMAAGVHAQDTAEHVTVPLSDPSRPGTVKVSVLQGNISVKASTGKDVIVTTQGRSVRPSTPPPDAAGLRRLGQPAGLSIEEENNVVSINLGPFGNRSDVEIQVPAKTNLQLSTVNGKELTVEGVDGDIEVTSVSGSITLTDVAGSVVAHATNGGVKVTLKQVTAQKAMSFTSLNGSVDVTLPPTTKANVKLRSGNGDLYTDFDVQIQPQSVKPLTTPAPRPAGGPLRIQVDRAVFGTVNGGGPEFELRTFNGNIYLRKGK